LQLLSSIGLVHHSQPTPHLLALIPLHPYTLPCGFETLVLTLSQLRQPSFRSHTLSGYYLIQIAHSHGGYDLRSLLIQIAHSLHTRLVSHLYYLGFLFYFINLWFVLCSHCRVICIWILNKFSSTIGMWERSWVLLLCEIFISVWGWARWWAPCVYEYAWKRKRKLILFLSFETIAKEDNAGKFFNLILADQDLFIHPHSLTLYD